VETAWDDRLRTAGLRVTRPRLSVLGVLAEHPHVDADSIATAARTVHLSISPQAVHGVLRALVGADMARRTEPAGGPALHGLRVGDDHHHLVCRGCGVVADVDCVVGQAPCLAPSAAAGSPSTRPRSSSGDSVPTARSHAVGTGTEQVQQRSEREWAHDRRRIAGPGSQ
jgi:Fe2+ or Zn2+ uptake regulation protein